MKRDKQKYKKYENDPRIYTNAVPGKPDEYRALLMDVRKVMNTPEGKNVVWNVLSACNLYSDIFTGNSQTFHAEGKRAIGLHILKLLEDADSTLYPNLLLAHQGDPNER